jgi:adenylate cyclase
MLIHPVLSAFTVALILLAFAVKTAARKHWMLHYAAGLGASALAVIGIIIAAIAIGQASADGRYTLAPTLPAHMAFAIPAAILLLVQAGIGLVMYFNVYTMRRLLPTHRQLGRALVILVLGISLFGGFTLLHLLQETVPRLLIGAAMVAMLLITGRLLTLHFRQAMRYRHVRRAASRRITLGKGKGTTVQIHYFPDDLEVQTYTHRSILTTSLEAGIPHTHVCGGHARCSTCRVAIVEGLEYCSPRNAKEQAMTERLRFAPEIRLACQTQVTGNVTVRRLVLDDEDVRITSQLNKDARPGSIGEEKHMAILFSDIRGFTSFAEALPPYDVIHALNRYYQEMDTALQLYGGEIDNYMGDGLLALFDGDDPAETSLRAIKAGLAMLNALAALQPYFEGIYGRRLDMGVGVHYGQVVLGNLGAPRRKRVTVIGDSVNFASRIESANKEAETRFLISDDTFTHVKDQVQIGKTVRLAVKGKTGEHTLYEVTGLADQDS